MSQDQKPARVRAVSSRDGLPGSGPENAGDVEESTAALAAAAAPARRAVAGKFVFLLGCALGGAGLAALPHILPGRF
ncbi:hypothetical protein [Sphingobium subterraneum]|uniref:Uncharacterized protein n=1 Tax=Sphingobium subterraneum TaxID=627688 RepID=A0A841J2B3_9SPHN|nr:hypothetical protein [Sphingobium subterraneum]MBB6122775.1 hypothetical protein [Sphingobium subterraneum]